MDVDTEPEVIIVGAGPGGLCLAGELALAGVRCTVLEQRGHRSVESRALGLQARTLELLELRGIASRFLDRGHPLDYFRVTVGPTRIDLRCLDTQFQQLNICPQSTTEELLEDRARELGATIERGVRVTGIEQDGTGATVRVETAAGSGVRRASWVVGSDGSKSVVRESAGIGFEGRSYPYNVIVGDVRLGKPPEDGMLIEVSKTGLVVAIDFGNGWWRMGAVDHDTPKPTSEPVTMAELDSAMTRIFGYDLEMSEPVWTSRFFFQRRQAATYRSGRVLLLGDAAHVHAPLGAQGVNLSLQDAMNLGWKLGAVVRGSASPMLLDTFQQERGPIATRVLDATDRAIRLMMSPRRGARMVRRVVVPGITGTKRGHRVLAGQISGIAINYPPAPGRQHAALVGRRVPDVTLQFADGTTRPLFPHFADGDFVLIDQSDGALAAVCHPWKDRIVVVPARVLRRPDLAAYSAILCRPDGYCAWAGVGADVSGLRAALNQWCGRPRSSATSAADGRGSAEGISA